MLFADRAAIYVRRSQEGEAEAKRLDAYARGQGYQIADQHYYGDRRAEGTPAHASDTFYAMMRAAERGEFAALFVTTAARITNDPAELETVKEELARAKVTLITLDSGSTTKTSHKTEDGADYIRSFFQARLRPRTRQPG
jgi:DNA invertase Pin-like site-specific DNA recombinase